MYFLLKVRDILAAALLVDPRACLTLRARGHQSLKRGVTYIVRVEPKIHETSTNSQPLTVSLVLKV